MRRITMPVGEVQCRCQWCGEPFIWERTTPNQRPPLFCRPAHGRAARKAMDQRTVPGSPCPTPSKRPFSNRRDASSALRRAGAAMREAHVYQCGCGAWHLGHPRYLRTSGMRPA